MSKVSKAYQQVFGGVNTSFSRSNKELKRPIRVGKTARERSSK